MRTSFLAGASALAFFLTVGAANAQSLVVDIGLDNPLSALDDDLGFVLGAGLVALDAVEGVYINAAINTGDVDGSVVLRGDGILDTGIGSVDLTVEGSAAAAGVAALNLDGTLLEPDLNLVGAVGLGVGAQLTLGIDGTVVSSTDVIETVAIGAVNDGTIRLGTTSAEFTSLEGYLDAGYAESAANTSNTAASASAGVIKAEVDFVNAAISGPQSDVYALNLAFNNAAVDGNVIATAGSVNLDGISTTAIGAVNTGVITNGCDACNGVSVE